MDIKNLCQLEIKKFEKKLTEVCNEKDEDGNLLLNIVKTKIIKNKLGNYYIKAEVLPTWFMKGTGTSVTIQTITYIFDEKGNAFINHRKKENGRIKQFADKKAPQKIQEFYKTFAELNSENYR